MGFSRGCFLPIIFFFPRFSELLSNQWLKPCIILRFYPPSLVSSPADVCFYVWWCVVRCVLWCFVLVRLLSCLFGNGVCMIVWFLKVWCHLFGMCVYVWCVLHGLGMRDVSVCWAICSAYLKPHLHICSEWLIKKQQLCNNWNAHVKSDLRSLPTYGPPKAAHAVYFMNIASA